MLSLYSFSGPVISLSASSRAVYDSFTDGRQHWLVGRLVILVRRELGLLFEFLQIPVIEGLFCVPRLVNYVL